MLAALILANAYSSVFYALLTVPEYEKPIDTIEDLVRIATHDTHQIIIKDQSSVHMTIMNATPENGVYYVLRKHLERSKRERLADISAGIPAVEADKRVVYLTVKMGTLARVQLFARKQLHISSEALGAIYLSWVVRKRSPLMVPFNAM